MPKSQRNCIKGWKKLMPDFEFICWDESNFDVDSYLYTRAACSSRKYAYISDVARCAALSKYGGIYLDTDVELFQSLEAYLDHGFFSAIEIYSEFEKVKTEYVDDEGRPLIEGQVVPWCGLLGSIIGCESRNVLISDCLSFYKNWSGGSFVTIDGLIARMALPYGFLYRDELQYLQERMVIYPTGIFGYAYSPNPDYIVSLHHNAASWQVKTRTQNRRTFLDKLGLLKLYDAVRELKRGKV